MNNKKIDIFWRDFQNHKGNQDDKKYTGIFSFGNNPLMADDLSALVIEGKKKATTSLYELYKLDNEQIPEKDKLSIVLNGSGDPVAVIKNTEVKIVPFKEITEGDARLEGEGDCSLKYWRGAHIQFFEEECREYKINFTEEMLVVFEIFETVEPLASNLRFALG